MFAFYFLMYHPISLNHLSVVRRYEKWTAAAEVAAVAGTAARPGRRRFSSVTNKGFFTTSKHLTINTRCWSRKRLVVTILYWMCLRQWHLRWVLVSTENNRSPFTVPQGMLSAAMPLHLLLVDDVTVTSPQWNSRLVVRIKFPTKRIFRIFHTSKINSMTPFSNLFMEQPSYLMFETKEWCKGKNSSLLELQYETSMNRNGD